MRWTPTGTHLPRIWTAASDPASLEHGHTWDATTGFPEPPARCPRIADNIENCSLRSKMCTRKRWQWTVLGTCGGREAAAPTGMGDAKQWGDLGPQALSPAVRSSDRTDAKLSRCSYRARTKGKERNPEKWETTEKEEMKWTNSSVVVG